MDRPGAAEDGRTRTVAVGSARPRSGSRCSASPRSTPCSAGSRCWMFLREASTRRRPSRGARRARARRRRPRRSPTEEPMDVDYSFLQASGSSSSRSSGSATSCSRASTSASGCCCACSAARPAERRAVIHTIGPVWDGNEVWLITAGGATFAAFPEWYATLFSGFYLALFLILVALIVRGVSFEFWGKDDSPRWRAAGSGRWCVGSFLAGAAVGRRVGEHRPRRADRRATASSPGPVRRCSTLRAARRRRRRCCCSSSTARSS